MLYPRIVSLLAWVFVTRVMCVHNERNLAGNSIDILLEDAKLVLVYAAIYCNFVCLRRLGDRVCRMTPG